MTARDSSGQVLASKDKTFLRFCPGGQLSYNDDLDVTAKPFKVEFTPLDSGFDLTRTRLADYMQFEFKSARLVCEQPGALFVSRNR